MMTDKNIPPMDVVQRDTDYVLFCGELPLHTPEGDEIAHHSPRLLDQIQREWRPYDQTEPSSATALDIFRTGRTLLRPDGDAALVHWSRLIDCDPLIDKAAFDKVSAKENDRRFATRLMEDHAHLALYFNGLANAIKCCNRFLLDFTKGHIDFSQKDGEHLKPLLIQAYQEMAVEEKAAVHLLGATHACGIILPMLLILRRITSSEYVHALFGLHTPQGPGKSDPVNPFKPLLSAPGSVCTLLPDWTCMETSFALLRTQTWSALDYVQSADPIRSDRLDVLQIIRSGENFNTEFKTSLRWNVKVDRKDPAIEHAALKTVNAFLNSSGGYLLIGVRDDGSVEGLAIDQFPNEDKYALHFWNLIKAAMGQEASPLIQATFEPIGERKVFVVHCAASAQPVFLQQKGQEDEFYIRVGPSSAKLSVKEALHYIAARFQGPLSA